MISVPCPPQRFFLQPAVPDTLRVAARASCSSMVTSVCSCFVASPIVAAACVYSVMSKGRPGTDPGVVQRGGIWASGGEAPAQIRLFCTTMSTALMWGLGPAPICTAAVACLIWKSPARGDRDDQLRQVPSVVLTRPPAHPSLRDAGPFLPRRRSVVPAPPASFRTLRPSGIATRCRRLGSRGRNARCSR